jgi:DNA polymerase-3 subunit delta'
MRWNEIPCDPRTAAELRDLVRSGRVPSSLLFCGPPGSGKRAAATACAQALHCRSAEAPCGACACCRRVAAGQHPDYRIWEPDGREFKVEQARALRAATHLRPFEAPLQVHVIAEAERMNEESSNALLKTLEEPSPHAVLILLTAAPSLLLATIRSRCRSIRFAPLAEAGLRSRLEQEDSLPPAEAAWRARLGRGSLERARQFAPDEPRRAARLVEALEDLAHDPSPGAIVRAAGTWCEETPAERPLERMLEVCRDAMLAGEAAPAGMLFHPELHTALSRLGARLGRRLPPAVERLEGALYDLRRPMKPQLLLEEAALLLLGSA